MRKKRVLITGAAGFLGSHLCDRFIKEGYHVVAMDNLITDAIMWKFKPDIALSNGFRFCQPLAVPENKNQVAITNEFLWNMLPVDSTAKTGEVTGLQILDWLEKELENAFATELMVSIC